MYQRIFLGLLLLSSCSWGLMACRSVQTNSALPIPLAKPALGQEVSEVESRLVVSPASRHWRTQTRRVPQIEELVAATIIDTQHAWLAEARLLHRTVDGHKWQQIVPPLEPDAEIVKSYFASPLVGWVAAQEQVTATPSQTSGFWLMKTENGGQSWVTQYQSQGSQATELVFLNENIGWLGGVKCLGLRPLRFTYFILHTSDGGHTWRDISPSLEFLRTKNEFAELVNDSVQGILAQGFLAATVITARGRLAQTLDDGQTWDEIGTIGDEPAQTSINLLGKTGKGLWAIGGADAIEGIYGLLIMEEEQNKLKKYRLSKGYFADGLFLSESEIIVAGAYAPRSFQTTMRQGVILYSQDRGRNWDIIYRTNQAACIIVIAKLQDEIWGVSDKGDIVRVSQL